MDFTHYAFLILLLVNAMATLRCRYIIKHDMPETRVNVKVKDKEIIDNDNSYNMSTLKNYFIKFETISGELLEMMVPRKIFDLLKINETGELIYESLQFLGFKKESKLDLYFKKPCYK